MTQLWMRLLVTCVMGFHLGHGFESETIREQFTAELLQTYGSNGLMTYKQFKVLGETLGLNATYINRTGDSYMCNSTNITSTCIKKCMGHKNIFELFSVNGLFNITTLEHAMSSLVYSAQDEHCHQVKGQEFGPVTKRRTPSSAEAWGYGFASTSLVVIISNIGVLFKPCMRKKAFDKILIFCVSLAVGTLACTGLMVLIPESMHLTGDDEPVPDYQWKLTSAMAGVYLFYVIEQLINLLKRREAKSVNDFELEATLNKDFSQITSNGKARRLSHGDGEIITVAWTLLLGDALHNFSDGLAIGAAFTTDLLTGISVTLAVLTEELPHELGDIAILLHSGMTIKRALLYNFLAAAVIYFGLIIGVVVGENTQANTYIFAFAGGLFIYIALTDMLPEMKVQAVNAEKAGESKWIVFIFQNLGLLLGFTIVLVLVTFGSNIDVN